MFSAWSFLNSPSFDEEDAHAWRAMTSLSLSVKVVLPWHARQTFHYCYSACRVVVASDMVGEVRTISTHVGIAQNNVHKMNKQFAYHFTNSIDCMHAMWLSEIVRYELPNSRSAYYKRSDKLVTVMESHGMQVEIYHGAYNKCFESLGNKLVSTQPCLVKARLAISRSRSNEHSNAYEYHYICVYRILMFTVMRQQYATSIHACLSFLIFSSVFSVHSWFV